MAQFLYFFKKVKYTGKPGDENFNGERDVNLRHKLLGEVKLDPISITDIRHYYCLMELRITKDCALF